MNKRDSVLTVLIVILLLVSGCTKREEAVSTTTPPTNNAPIETPEKAESADASKEQRQNVLSTILDCTTEDINMFSYYDNPKIFRSWNGALVPIDSDSVYDCGLEGANAYTETETACCRKLSEALAAYPLQGEPPEEIDDNTPLPTGQYFMLLVEINSDWNPVLTFFDSGEVFIDWNRGRNQEDIPSFWCAVEPSQFNVLKAVLMEIHKELDSLPLDYQTESWISCDSFRPESRALGLNFKNRGGNVIRTNKIVMEKQEVEIWKQVGEVQATDLEILPRELTKYSIDLTQIPGAQEQGKYRVRGTFEANGESLSWELPYTIDAEVQDISYPPIPKMTPENENYCKRYVNIWGKFSPFPERFSEDNYITEIHTYLIYEVLTNTERKNIQTYEEDISSETVEGTIMRHFLFTKEQIRAETATKEQNDSEYYDPSTNTYHFEGGYGGGSSCAVVSESHQNGNLLTLTCDWYGMDGVYINSQELTLRLGEDEDDFVYVAGHTLEDRQDPR